MENSNISQGLADIIESKAVSPQITQNLNIYKVENGFVITVGCKIFVAKTWEEASQGIGEYWENPQEAEKKYTSKE